MQESHSRITETLVRDARAGNAAARSELLDRYGPRVLRVVRRRMGQGLRRRAESGDVAQDVMVEVIRSLPDFTPRRERTFFRWVCRIVENRLRNHARNGLRHGMERAPTAAIGALQAPPNNTAESNEEYALLASAMAAISPDHRAVLQLRHDTAVSWREIGARLDRTEKAAQMLYTRAKTELVTALHRLRREAMDGNHR